MFSLVHQLLIKQLAYPAPERLVRITGTYPRAAIPFFQQRSRTMDVAAVSSGSDLNLTGQGVGTRVATARQPHRSDQNVTAGLRTPAYSRTRTRIASAVGIPARKTL